MVEDVKKLRKDNVNKQFLAALAANLLSVGYGLNGGWICASMNVLTSDETPLASGKITMDDISLMTAIICIGALVGNVLFGYITVRFGRTKPLMAMSIPSIIVWVLILYAPNVYYLHMSRMLNGFVGGGIFIIIPGYLKEIASDRVRGTLGSILVFAYNIGFLAACILAYYFNFYMTPKIAIIAMLLFMATFIFFPESPLVLIKQNKLPEAERSLRFYQSLRESDEDKKHLESEMAKLKNSLETKAENFSACEKAATWTWSDLIVNPGRKATIIALAMACMNQFTGCLAILNYSASIFKDTGSTMSPILSTIVVAVIQLFGSYAATFFVDRAGRKILYAVSTMGATLGEIILGVYMLLKSLGYDVNQFNWIPVFSISLIVFVASCAILTLPFVVVSEVFPEKLKDFGMSSYMIIAWSFAFIANRYLPHLIAALTLHGSMFLFAGISFTSFLYVIILLPETKGKSYDQIMEMLSR